MAAYLIQFPQITATRNRRNKLIIARKEKQKEISWLLRRKLNETSGLTFFMTSGRGLVRIFLYYLYLVLLYCITNIFLYKAIRPNHVASAIHR